jgi:hypothetical protein
VMNESYPIIDGTAWKVRWITPTGVNVNPEQISGYALCMPDNTSGP